MEKPRFRSRRGKRRPLRMVAMAAAAVVLVTACGGGAQPAEKAQDDGGTTPIMLTDAEWQDVVAAAKEEGELVVYTSAGATEEAFTKFSEAYPEIKLTTEMAATADLITRLDQEMSVGSPAADVTYHAQVGWYADRGDDKSLAPLKLSPESQASFEGLELGRYYVPVARAPYSVAFNTNLGQPVSSIDELLKVLGDKPIGIIDAANSIPQSYQYFRWQEIYGDDVLNRLASHKLSVYTSGASLSQSLASGEIAYGLGQPPGYVPVVKAQGAPVDEVVLPEGTVGAQYGPAVLAQSRHPNAAQVFVNWLLSPEGQEVVLSAQGGAVATEVGDSLKWATVELAPWTSKDQEAWLRDDWGSAVHAS